MESLQRSPNPPVGLRGRQGRGRGRIEEKETSGKKGGKERVKDGMVNPQIINPGYGSGQQISCVLFRVLIRL